MATKSVGQSTGGFPAAMAGNEGVIPAAFEEHSGCSLDTALFKRVIEAAESGCFEESP